MEEHDRTSGEFFAKTALGLSMKMLHEQDQIIHAVTSHIDNTLSKQVAAGMTQALRELMSDEELMDAFWKAGYKNLTNQASSGASQWIGKRILVAAGAAMFVWLMGWLFKNGAFK